MDTVAFVGPLLAMLVMAFSNDDFRLVFWTSLVPAAIASPPYRLRGSRSHSARGEAARRFPIQRAELARLSADFWWLVGVATVLTLARFSDAFLLLAAQHVGMTVALIPAILVTMNVVYAISAYPFGRLTNLVSRRTLFLLGIGILIAADLILATAADLAQVIVGSAIWGLHMGVTQSLLSALIADAVPGNLRGTALGSIA